MRFKLPHKVPVIKVLKSVPGIIILSVIVLLGGTYGVWKFQTYYLPISRGTLPGEGVSARLSSSDHYCNPNCSSSTNFVSLSTDINGSESPDYDSTIANGPTSLKNMTTYFQMFRMQSRLSYYLTSSDHTRSVPATLSYSLPPKLLYMPNQLSFKRKTYAFSEAKTCFLDGSDCAANIKVDLVTTDDPNSTNDDRYVVSLTTIEPFNKRISLETTKKYLALGVGTAEAYNPPPATNLAWLHLPKEVRLSFNNSQSTIPNIRTMRGYIDDSATPALVREHANYGNASCGTDSAGLRRYLCFKSQIDFKVGTQSVVGGSQYLMQQIDYSTVPGGISVKGNVAALTNLNGFTIATPYAIVYGGTIANDVSGGQEISNYLANTKLDWTVVKPQIQSLLDNSRPSATAASALTSMTWYLNSPTSNPNNTANATTFSTPPEGKLWSTSSSLSVPGAVEFRGSGTIIVNGSVTFNGPVTCSAGTRLGIIASGSITFRSSTIGCGSYVSMNDNISFTSTKTGKASGIFIAANSIVLPKMDDGELFEINYDTTFVSNPTVIFEELLKIINLTTIS